MPHTVPYLTTALCVAQALHRLLTVDIGPLLNPKVFAPPNPWRVKHLYHEEVDLVLRAHESSLQHLFRALQSHTQRSGPLCTLCRVHS